MPESSNGWLHAAFEENVLALQRMLRHKRAKMTLHAHSDWFDELDAVAAQLGCSKGPRPTTDLMSQLPYMKTTVSQGS